MNKDKKTLKILAPGPVQPPPPSACPGTLMGAPQILPLNQEFIGQSTREQESREASMKAREQMAPLTVRG